MACGMLRCSISSLLEDLCLQLDSPRLTDLKRLGSAILKKATEEEGKFDDFSTELISTIRSVFTPQKTFRSSEAKRTKYWTSFNEVRVTKLPKIWTKFLSGTHIEVKDKLLQQSVNQRLFEMLLPEQFPSQSSSIQTRTLSLAKDELNVLQYVGGYVPHALLKKYDKLKGTKYEQFIECLGDMAVESEHTDIFEYTKEWINKVNRGGLFPLNDITYQLFIAIEKEVQVILPQYLASARPSDCKSKENFQLEVVDKVCNSDDVQWHWTLLSTCIDSEDHAIELLREIATLCITIRGFSIAATWLEVYKLATRKTVKRSSALRKELSRPDNPDDD